MKEDKEPTKYILFYKNTSNPPEIYSDLSDVAKIIGRHRNTIGRFFKNISFCYRNVIGFTIFEAKYFKSKRGSKKVEE